MVINVIQILKTNLNLVGPGDLESSGQCFRFGLALSKSKIAPMIETYSTLLYNLIYRPKRPTKGDL